MWTSSFQETTSFWMRSSSSSSISWSSSFTRYLCAPLRLRSSLLARAVLSALCSLSPLFSILPAGFHDQHQNDADSADEAPLWLLKHRRLEGARLYPYRQTKTMFENRSENDILLHCEQSELYLLSTHLKLSAKNWYTYESSGSTILEQKLQCKKKTIIFLISVHFCSDHNC